MPTKCPNLCVCVRAHAPKSCTYVNKQISLKAYIHSTAFGNCSMQAYSNEHTYLIFLQHLKDTDKFLGMEDLSCMIHVFTIFNPFTSCDILHYPNWLLFLHSLLKPFLSVL